MALGTWKLVWGLRIEGLENVPLDGPLLVTSNHVSNLDPPILGAVLSREAGFAAKKELFAVLGLGALIRSLNAIPVDRAELSVGTLRAFGRVLDGGKALILFPEGTRSRSGQLGKARSGVGMILTRHPVPIVPVYIEGTDSLFRSFFRRGRMRVVFGRPYTLPRESGTPSSRRARYREIAETVLNRIREMKEGAGNSSRETGAPK